MNIRNIFKKSNNQSLESAEKFKELYLQVIRGEYTSGAGNLTLKFSSIIREWGNQVKPGEVMYDCRELARVISNFSMRQMSQEDALFKVSNLESSLNNSKIKDDEKDLVDWYLNRAKDIANKGLVFDLDRI